MISRVVRAFRLDARMFTRAALAEGSSDETVLVALLVATLAGVGVAVTGKLPLLAFLVEMLNSLIVGWLLPSLLAVRIAEKLGCRLDLPGVQRVLAYASVPRLLLFFGFIPAFGWLFRIPGWTLGLILSIVALREYSGREDPRFLLLAVLPASTIYIITSALVCLAFDGLPFVGM